MHHFSIHQWLSIALLFLIVPSFLCAQKTQDLNALKLVQKKDDLTLVYYTIATIYADSTSASFQLDSAYHYIVQVEQMLRKLSDKEENNVREVLKPTPVKLRREITQRALANCKKFNTLVAYDHYLEYYKKADAADEEQAIKLRNQLALSMTQASNTYEQLNDTWTKYGSSIQAKDGAAFLQLEKNLFEAFLRQYSWAAYSQFAVAHPQHLYVGKNVKERFVQMCATDKPAVVENFIKTFASTPFEKLAVDSFAAKTIRSGDLKYSAQFLTKYPTHPQTSAMWLAYYNSYKKQFPTQLELQNFKEKNPKFPYQKELEADIKVAAEAAYQAAMQSDDLNKSRQFIKYNAAHSKVDSVWLHLFELDRKKSPSLASLESFQQDYSAFPFPKRIEQARPAAIKYDYQQILKSSDQDRSLAFIAKHPAYAKIDSVWLHFFNSYQAQAKDMSAWERFQAQYPAFPFPQLVKTAIAKTQQKTENQAYQSLSRTVLLQDYFEFLKQYPKSSYKDSVGQRMTTLAMESKNIQELEGYLLQYSTSEKRQALLLHLYELYKNQKELQGIEEFEKKYPDFLNQQSLNKDKSDFRKNLYKPFRLSNKINSSTDDYSVVISADGKTLYFSSDNRSDGVGGEDIFVSYNVDGAWTQAALVKELSTAAGNEAPLAISTDGNELIYFDSGILYTCRKTEQGWSGTKQLPNTINRDGWQADPHITADGMAMLFASGASLNSNIDIYVSLRKPDGTWAEAINLGKKINTNLEDRSPLLHPDMKTLYFSSDGRRGKGELDIYMSERLDSTWTNWSEPRNLGDTLNTAGDDWNFKVTTDGQLAYFSRGTADFDIYKIYLPKSYQPDTVVVIDRTFTDGAGKPVAGAKVTVRNLETGQILQRSETDPSGRLYLSIPKNQEGTIGYTIEKDSIMTYIGKVDLQNEEKKEVEDTKMYTPEEARKAEIKLPINNLFFETNQFLILPKSYLELDLLAETIQKYNLRIEIHGHTDDVGSPESNQLLSQNRANSVRKYLVQKGCDQDRLIAIGFGETAPLDTSPTADGKAKNRRVELKIKK